MPVQLLGETALMRRLAAISGPNVMAQTLKLIAIASNREQKLLVHRKTGTTARTISYRMTGANSVDTYAAGAAVFSLGTKPHTITPNAKKALFFASQGITTERFGAGAKLTFRLSGALSAGSAKKYGNAAFVLTKLVHHPGTAPWPFMLPGAVAGVQQAGVDPIIVAWNEG